MDVFDAIRNRRSIRSYLDRPVEREKIMQVIEAGRLAPSANNRQEWRFVVVQDRECRHRLAIAANGQGFVAEAPVVIACCAVEFKHVMACGHPSYAIDLGIAIDHMTLAAVPLGLGTCWVGSFQEPRVREILGIPDTARVVELLTLGYPKETPAPRPRKKPEEIVFWETWS